MASNIQIASESAAAVPPASAVGKVRIFRDAADGALKFKNENGVVFNIASIQSFKEPVRVATDAALPAYTRMAGIITADANGALPAIDGVSLSAADSFLFLDGADAEDNGIWEVLQVGSGALPFILERRADAADSSQFVPGMLVATGPEGSTNDSALYTLATASPIVLNTTALTFQSVSAGVENFSIAYVPDGETRTVAANDQMLYVEPLVVDGDLVVDGNIFDAAPLDNSNVNDLLAEDAAASRTSLGVYSTTEVDAAITAAHSTQIDATISTSDATPTILHTYTVSSPNTVVHKVQVQALSTPADDTALFDTSALSLQSFLGPLVSKDVTFVNGPYKDAGAAAWDVTMVVSGSDLQLTVTGSAATNIVWRVTGTIVELT